MSLAGAEGDLGAVPDPSYPTTSAPDSVYPCQTFAAFAEPLNGIAMPFIWSRLEMPLEKSMETLWCGLKLQTKACPEVWITLHHGRIAMNAHGWERLRARLADAEPDPALVEPAPSGWMTVVDYWERWRSKRARRAWLQRLEKAEAAGEVALIRAASTNPGDLDTAELARGPLDVRSWTEILMAWLGVRLLETDLRRNAVRVQAAIGLEQQFGAELGRRLSSRGAVHHPAEVGYMTVDERLRAVHEVSGDWSKRASERYERVQHFVDLDLPEVFWGRPRVGCEKTS